MNGMTGNVEQEEGRTIRGSSFRVMRVERLKSGKPVASFERG